MQIDQALNHTDEWIKGVTLHEGAQGWRVACATLAAEVRMADWYLCETCGDLADSLAELGFCYTLGDDSLAKQIDEYRREEAAHREYMKTHNAELRGRPLADGPA
jgi:hypothetical protein